MMQFKGITISYKVIRLFTNWNGVYKLLYTQYNNFFCIKQVVEDKHLTHHSVMMVS